MSRKRLTTAEMIHLSGEWLDPQSPAHKAIVASGDLAPTIPRLQSAHQDLVTAAQPTALNPRLFQIIKEQTDADDRHDDVIRGIHGVLTATASLLGPTEGAPLLALRDHLIPDGLSSVQKSYGAEAGQAAQLSVRLTPEIRPQIDEILVGSKTAPHVLGQFIDEWIELGQKLGALENEKARLNPSDAASSAGAGLVAARNKWIRTVNLFLAVAEAIELDYDTERVVFGPLHAAESKADRRGRATASAGDTAEPANT
jgi:hypothetical protein